MEKTLILVKPDGVQRGLVGEIIGRLERKGLRIAGLKMVHVNEELANKHYGEHVGKPFFDSLVKFITSSPLVAMALEGENAVEVKIPRERVIYGYIPNEIDKRGFYRE